MSHNKPKKPQSKKKSAGGGGKGKPKKNHGIVHYGVLKGKASEGKLAGTPKPHYQIHIEAAGEEHRIAVNVLSDESPSELLFFLEPDFHHPLLAQLAALGEGFRAVPSQPGGLALDFIRGNLFPPDQMKVVPLDAPGPADSLHKLFDFHVKAAIDRGADVYAFGSKWGPEKGKPDQYFGFEPGNGIHDIHMNQGSIGPHSGDNGVFQDGGLFLHFADEDRWLAFFLAFQSQSFHTDDTTGNAIPGPRAFVPVAAPPPAQPTAGVPEAPAVRIVAAVVQPKTGAAPSVTLLNATPGAVDLAGWTLTDDIETPFPLAVPSLAAGEAVRVPLAGRRLPGGGGGILTLLDASGLKIHGVSYTQQDAARAGWSVLF
ncbi:MAG TPA: DUF2278 family protein [Thermoanaerobaculia bacterium]